MSIKSNFKRGFYTSLIVAAGLLASQEAKGQAFMPPKGNINMFQSLDTTENAKIYNAAKTKEQRDSIIAVRLAEDWVDQVPYDLSLWNCNQYELQLIVNSRNWGDGIISDDRPLYNNYSGSELDLQKIYQNGGTLENIGLLGLPTYYLGLYDENTLKDGHGMNAILTGNDAIKFEDWTFIEPQNDAINVKPGQSSVFPKNCKQVQIYYNYLFKNKTHEKNLGMIKVLEFEVTDGKGTLTYNINNDNTTIIPWASPDPLNKYIKLIEKRSDIIDDVKEYTLENTVDVYPNPAHNYINIESKLNEPTTNKIKIFDITGRLVKEYTTMEAREQIDVSDLPAAIYLVNTERKTNNGQIYKETDKFVKQ
jgi:hypothetical protein